MKPNRLKNLITLGIALTTVALSGQVLAGGHISFDIVVAPPVVYEPHYRYEHYEPYRYHHHHYQYAPEYVVEAPPVYVAPAPRPVYVPARQAANTWYYCAASNAYYPDVTQCRSGWQQVLAP